MNSPTLYLKYAFKETKSIFFSWYITYHGAKNKATFICPYIDEHIFNTVTFTCRNITEHSLWEMFYNINSSLGASFIHYFT